MKGILPFLLLAFSSSAAILQPVVPAASSSFLLVTTNGNDSTGARNTSRAFGSLEAAMSYSSNYDVIYLGPGSHVVSNLSTKARLGLRISGVSRFSSRIQHNPSGIWLNITNENVLENFTFTTLATTSEDTTHHIFFGRSVAGGATNFIIRNVDAIGQSDYIGAVDNTMAMVGGRWENCNWITEYDSIALGTSGGAYFSNSFFNCNAISRNGPTYANHVGPPLHLVSANSVIHWYGGSIIASNSANAASYVVAATGDGAQIHLHSGTHLERWDSGVQSQVTVYGDPLGVGEIHFWDTVVINTNIVGLTPDVNNIIFHPTPVQYNERYNAYAAGTVYTFTGSSALLDFGTTDPSITIASAGTYLLTGTVGVKYNAATYAGAQTVTVKFRRTNNTAADLTSGGRAIELPVLTTFTGGDSISLPSLIYTATAGDIIQLFGLVSATPAAGSVTAENADLMAVRLY